MTHTDPNQSPPLPDLDDIQRQIGEWEEAMLHNADQGRGKWHYGTAARAFGRAYNSVSAAREALKVLEEESVA